MKSIITYFLKISMIAYFLNCISCQISFLFRSGFFPLIGLVIDHFLQFSSSVLQRANCSLTLNRKLSTCRTTIYSFPHGDSIYGNTYAIILDKLLFNVCVFILGIVGIDLSYIEDNGNLNIALINAFRLRKSLKFYKFWHLV